MRKNIILILVLIVVVLFSGCTNQPNDGNDGTIVQYSDNALALVDYKTNTRVYHNEETSIEFWLTNQVEYDVTNVYVKLFNPNVFNITKIICDGKENIGGDSCHFDVLSTTEAKEIQIFLKAPSEEQIGSIESEYKVDLSVKYDYSGDSTCYFRILAPGKEKSDTKMQLTQTTGPVHVNIEPSFLIQEKTDQGTKTISDWTIAGKPFNVKISTENVGSLGSDYTFPVIGMSSFNVFLTNAGVEDKTVCVDFNVNGNILTNENITVPTKKPLTCILTPIKDFTQPEISGIIRAHYSYTYEFIKTETFNIVSV